MATIQNRNDSFRILFIHHGKRYAYPLGKVPRRVAESKAAKTDEVLALLKGGYITIPPAVDIVTFVRHEGKLPSTPTQPGGEGVTLAGLRDRYLATHRNGALEATTLSGVELHFKHLVATLGDRFPLANLTLADLQKHADRRAKMKYGGGLISSATIRKELISLRTVWNWGVHMDLLNGPFPALKRVKLKKPEEKPHFQTRQEIERQIRAGVLAKKQIEELWDALYLTAPEIVELLEYVRVNAHLPFIYPMFCFAAHTGARRSELLRAQVSDVDFAGQTAVIHERKRSHDKRTTRRVPLTPALLKALEDWLKIHPGGPHLFCQSASVVRSKTKRQGPTAITRDEAHDHFKRPLFGSKWVMMKGWHTLRHSFVSCLASAGVDQRYIDEFVGHSTEQQRKRYRHLHPSVKRQAISDAFGGTST